MKQIEDLNVDKNSWKLKDDWKIWGCAWSKSGCGFCGHMTQNLAVSQEKINGINWFVTHWYISRKTKNYFDNFCVVVVENRRSSLGHRTLKSAIPQNWMDELSWYKFRKAEKYYNIYRMGVIKKGRGLLCNETLKPGLPQEWFDKLSWFFACW